MSQAFDPCARQPLNLLLLDREISYWLHPGRGHGWGQDMLIRRSAFPAVPKTDSFEGETLHEGRYE